MGGAHAFEVFVQNHPFFGRRMDTRDQDGEGEVHGGARVRVVSAALRPQHQQHAGPVWKSILEKM